MSKPIKCDGCGREITHNRGWKWATFKRKWRYRVVKFVGRGQSKQRYDFCRHCWGDIVGMLGDDDD